MCCRAATARSCSRCGIDPGTTERILACSTHRALTTRLPSPHTLAREAGRVKTLDAAIAVVAVAEEIARASLDELPVAAVAEEMIVAARRSADNKPDAATAKGGEGGEKANAAGALTDDEERATGEVPWAVYGYYVNAGGVGIFLLAVLSALGGRAFELLSSFWVSHWANQVERHAKAHPDDDAGIDEDRSQMFIRIYALWGMLGIVGLCVRSVSERTNTDFRRASRARRTVRRLRTRGRCVMLSRARRGRSSSRSCWARRRRVSLFIGATPSRHDEGLVT